jgi:hypothetical protein
MSTQTHTPSGRRSRGKPYGDRSCGRACASRIRGRSFARAPHSSSRTPAEFVRPDPAACPRSNFAPDARGRPSRILKSQRFLHSHTVQRTFETVCPLYCDGAGAPRRVLLPLEEAPCARLQRNRRAVLGAARGLRLAHGSEKRIRKALARLQRRPQPTVVGVIQVKQPRVWETVHLLCRRQLLPFRHSSASGPAGSSPGASWLPGSGNAPEARNGPALQGPRLAACSFSFPFARSSPSDDDTLGTPLPMCRPTATKKISSWLIEFFRGAGGSDKALTSLF